MPTWSFTESARTHGYPKNEIDFLSQSSRMLPRCSLALAMSRGGMAPEKRKDVPGCHLSSRWFRPALAVPCRLEQSRYIVRSPRLPLPNLFLSQHPKHHVVQHSRHHHALFGPHSFWNSCTDSFRVVLLTRFLGKNHTRVCSSLSKLSSRSNRHFHHEDFFDVLAPYPTLSPPIRLGTG